MTIPTLPVLTFPRKVGRFLRRSYAAANVILEYGSGGSTFVAAALPGRTVFSVESDPDWAEKLRAIAAAHDLASPPTVIFCDIGPVGPWARAVSHLRLQDFFGYAQAVWDRGDFSHPDVVLVDGRFRAACFMATYLNAERPVRLLFDDYRKRTEYHVVERLCRPTRLVGRMAVFDLCPEDRLAVEPWRLVATFFEAVCSFKVGLAPPRRRLKQRLADAFVRLVRPMRRRSVAAATLPHAAGGVLARRRAAADGAPG